MPADLALPSDYPTLLADLKAQIRQAQTRAALSVNRELILLYWQIGQTILQKQKEQGWGAKIIDQLSRDLKKEFPELKGFSRSNLSYMTQFATTWPDEQIIQQLVGQIPWGHNITLMQQLKDPQQRQWYAHATIKHGWSRNVLVHQIESQLIHRQGQASTNFDRTLPAPQSELAQQLLKDPYNFDFLNLHDAALERDLEQGLLTHLRDFMLELGVGFAFMGSQVHLEVEDQDYYLDLLFYHVKLRCYVIIDLKMGAFKPEYAGKMNFYLSAADDLLRHPQDGPSIGLILCKTKGKITAEYALRDVNKPLGISTYQLAEGLPADLKGQLPSIEALEEELARMEGAENGE